ncbi:MAG: hypothetical protein IPJ85_14115 [Flavobacteriales bacterium]|nr:hypothetical protein [Flavobacteriales bacterium]
MQASPARCFRPCAASRAAEDRVLVIVQLYGGNDGLNTVIPLDQYSTSRPSVHMY